MIKLKVQKKRKKSKKINKPKKKPKTSGISLVLFFVFLIGLSVETTRTTKAADTSASKIIVDGEEILIPGSSEKNITYLQILQKPNDLDLNLKYAQQQGKIGNYKQTIATLERLNMVYPDNVEIKLYLLSVLVQADSPNKALSIIEDKTLDDLENEDRTELTKRFEEYKKSGQIVFTTFHQSMSYEDFVEGIKPSTNDDDNVIYNVEDGIFKEISEKSKGISSSIIKPNRIDFTNVSYFKMSLGGKKNKTVHDWCIQNNHIALGWGGKNDLSSLVGINSWDKFKTEFTDNFPDNDPASRLLFFLAGNQ